MSGIWERFKSIFGKAPPAASQKPAAAASSAAPSAAAPAPASAPRAARSPEDFQNPEILGLSRDELRERALKVDPYRTAWIGRVDTIPPQSDLRTALIDRGLILRGLLKEEQINEIHRVGDLWIKHHDAARLAETLAARTANEAVEQQRQERARAKAEKKRLAAEREAKRAQEVARRRAEDIVHLGRGVSSGLADRRANVEALQTLGLPVLASPADVARALSLGVPRLRWLAFHSEAAERTHYVTFEIPKRSGGQRVISAPHKELAQAQEWILRNILDKLPTEGAAHGFIKKRSTVTNAAPHLKRDLVVNLDLKDFFPSITFPRVRGVFRRLGYSPAASTVLALLCTECPRRKVEYDGQPYWVAVGPRGLPQGACTSPALANQVARKLDRRLKGMSAKSGWTYTRYADDLTFSAEQANEGNVAMLLARVRHIVGEEGFALNLQKGRVQRRSGRQTVTGIVVNDRPGVPREEIRALRALLYNARKTGLEAQNREGIPHFEAWLRGKLAYVAMVDRAKGIAMLRELDALPKAGARVG